MWLNWYVNSSAINEKRRKSRPGISSRRLANLCFEYNRRINGTRLQISTGEKAWELKWFLYIWSIILISLFCKSVSIGRKFIQVRIIILIFSIESVSLAFRSFQSLRGRGFESHFSHQCKVECILEFIGQIYSGKRRLNINRE